MGKSIKVKNEIHKGLKVYASLNDMDLSKLVNDILEKWLMNQKDINYLKIKEKSKVRED